MTTYPRETAIRILTRVLSDRWPLDEAFSELAAGSEDARPENRAWLQEICAGTLRWKGRLDLAIDSVALRKKPSGWLRKALLITSYQLIVQERTNPAAVVSETVEQIRAKEGEAPARFANALLRKIGAHALDWRQLSLRAGAPAAEAAAWASLPDWLWKKLVADHGETWARAYAVASLERPVLWLRARRSEWKPEWAERGPLENSLRVTQTQGGQISGWEGFTEAEFIVQDVSNQKLIGEVTTEMRREPSDRKQRVLDLCAAPGGKSIGMAWNGFEVLASDRDEKRLQLLKQSVERASASVQVLAPEAARQLTDMDAVWVDAPCTGTGTLRKNPEIRWLKKESDLGPLTNLQEQLLKSAWKQIRPGGFLVYSVCSVLKDEGPLVVAQAGLADAIIKTWSLAPQDAPGGDGFWGALLRKS